MEEALTATASCRCGAKPAAVLIWPPPLTARPGTSRRLDDDPQPISRGQARCRCRCAAAVLFDPHVRELAAALDDGDALGRPGNDRHDAAAAKLGPSETRERVTFGRRGPARQAARRRRTGEEWSAWD